MRAVMIPGVMDVNAEDVNAESAGRVVSLLASGTEIVCALGCADRLVGRSHECDYPAAVLSLPICTEPKFDVEGRSYQIDQRVRAIVEQALSVYRVDGELLRELAPDVIVTQSQCEVCAVSPRDLDDIVDAWVGGEPCVVALEPRDLGHIWRDIRLVAEALGVAARGAALAAELEERMRAIGETASKAGTRPRVACVEWIEPLMSGGNWLPELVDLAGGVNLFGEAGEYSPLMSFPDLVAADPEVIFVMPCGFDIARTREELPPLTERPQWAGLKAVRDGRVYLADGNQYFNRSGPRLVESLEILAEVLHPDLFRFGHEGPGWVTC